MQSLNSFLWEKQKIVFLALSGIIIATFLTFLAVGLRVYKERQLESVLQVSLLSINATLKVGDWALTQKFIEASITGSEIYGVTVATSANGLIAGPIGYEKFGLIELCSKKDALNSAGVAGCIKVLSSFDIIIFIFIAFIIIGFFLASFIMTKHKANSVFLIIQDRLNKISSIESSSKLFEDIDFEVIELKMLFEKIKNLIIKTESISKEKAMIEVAQQVSHDIRSPLAALNTITNSLGGLQEEKRILIRNSVQRINDIANNLLNKSKRNFEHEIVNESNLSIELISPIVDSIISEKRTQFRDRTMVNILIDLDKSYGLFSKVNPAELKRVISNLINNAVEAADSDKLITVHVIVKVYDSQNLSIIIRDNGRGIPLNILDKLGEKGVSEGKIDSLSGSGLGVYHAKRTIESLGGKLLIESDSLSDEKGSTFSIILKIAESPIWFVQELLIDNQKSIVSLDDDVFIHQIWTDRLKSIINKESEKIEHFIFNSGNEFLKSAPMLVANANYFLIDLELLGQGVDGLDIIEKIICINPQILEKTILVTSRYEEVQVKETVCRLGIKLIPKAMAGFVPIVLYNAEIKYDAVLLDDDELVRMTWSMQADRKNVKLKVYTFAHDLIKELKQFDNSIPFYVDSNLGKDIEGNEIKGEVILEYLYKAGFTELFLCTGYEPERFSHLSFIKKVFTKSPQI